MSIFFSDGTVEKGASTLLNILAPYIAAKGGGSNTFAFAAGTNTNQKDIINMLSKAEEWLN